MKRPEDSSMVQKFRGDRYSPEELIAMGQAWAQREAKRLQGRLGITLDAAPQDVQMEFERLVKILGTAMWIWDIRISTDIGESVGAREARIRLSHAEGAVYGFLLCWKLTTTLAEENK